MANQAEVQRINNSTIQELAAIIESHNRELRDQEVKALKEKLDNLKWLLGMKVKTLKVREASHGILEVKHNQVDRECKRQVNRIESQLKQMKTFQRDNKKKHYRVKANFRQSNKDWLEKEEIFVQEIEKMSSYINDLHSTMARHEIPNDQLIEESDEYETDEDDMDWNIFLYRQTEAEYDSDTQFEDDDYDDEFEEPDNRFQYQRSSYHQQNRQHEQSRVIAEEYDDDFIESHSETQNRSEVIQRSELIQDNQYAEEPVKSFAEPIALESNMSMSSNEGFQDKNSNIENINPQQDCCEMTEEDEQNRESCQDDDQIVENGCIETFNEVQSYQEESQCSVLSQESQCNHELVESIARPMASEPDKTISSKNHEDPKEQDWCDMIKAEESNKATELVHNDLSVSDPAGTNEDEQSQKASSTSNTEYRDKVLESEEPIKPEILPLKFSFDPFVHGYVEKKCEKSKSKKPRQRKPKSKAKF